MNPATIATAKRNSAAPVNESGSEGSNGATIVINDGHGNTLATFDVISDLPSGEIPEPSTVLLVGAALPGIWGIKRRRGRNGLPVGIMG